MSIKTFYSNAHFDVFDTDHLLERDLVADNFQSSYANDHLFRPKSTTNQIVHSRKEP